MASVVNRLKHAWNAFTGGEDGRVTYTSSSAYSYSRPDRTRLTFSNERSLISSIYTRLSIDVAQIDIRHVRLDDDKRYLEDVDSGLNNCLTLEANLDQGARAFRQDIALTLFDKGVAAIVPVDTTINPMLSGSFDIQTMRVGEIVGWEPEHVTVSVYNQAKGMRENVRLQKKFVAIVENPLYSVMNEPNSTLQRLIRKLNLLDTIDEQSGSGKLDLIIQLPYVIKSEARRQQADQRRKDIESQLQGSKYGIAYTDGTEKITQLNRPAENNLLNQVEYLTKMLYTQLGLTEGVMDGSANEESMLHYHHRTIEPIITAIVEAMRRAFLTKTGRTQGQSVMAFRDPFKFVPIKDMAEIADKFARNEIMTSNEIRQGIGMKPAKDPKADKLINSNMPQPAPSGDSNPSSPPNTPTLEDQAVKDGVASMNAAVDKILADAANNRRQTVPVGAGSKKN